VTDLLELDEDGPPLDAAAARDAIAAALGGDHPVVVVPVARLPQAFWDLRSGLAGEIAQLFVTYRRRLVVLGPPPPAALASRAVEAWMREANRGRDLWFVRDREALAVRLRRANPDGR